VFYEIVSKQKKKEKRWCRGEGSKLHNTDRANVRTSADHTVVAEGARYHCAIAASKR
jgi:hypothetical protein